MYLLKIEGKAKIPDYVEIRDNEFTLIGYFTVNHAEKGIIEAKLEEYRDLIFHLIKTTPFGRIVEMKKN